MSEREKRGVARTAFALTICLILTFVILTTQRGDRFASSTAFAQASPTPSGFQIEWVNPDGDTSNEVSAQAKTGRSDLNNFHLVAWVNRIDPEGFVEFCIDDCNPSSERITPEGDGATFVEPDTYEWFWSNLPADTATDTTVVLRARYFISGNLADEATENIVINNQAEQAPPGNTVSEGVEILDPEPTGNMGFYKSPGADTYLGVIEVAATAGTTLMEAKYTITATGSEPVWKSCGFESTEDSADGIRCELVQGDIPENVNGVAVVTYEGAADPEMPADIRNRFREGADGHPVDGYTQVPDELVLEFVNADGSSAGDAPSANPGVCSLTLRATARDQNDEPVPGVNVDFHAQGPDDDIRFVDVDAAKAPDQGGHTTSDPQTDCEGANDGTQGEHDAPAGDDTKHVESTDNTDDLGRFSVQLFHANSGDVPGETQISGWADLDGNDVFCSEEPSDVAAVGWGQGASATGVGSETDSCTLPGSSPTPTATSTPSSSPSPTESESPTTSPSPTPETERVATTLSIRYRRGTFSGTAESSRDRCRGGRAVTVRKQRRGPDPRVGSDRTARNGAWSVKARRARGKHYAVVAAKRYTESNGTIVVCRKDKSPTIRAKG